MPTETTGSGASVTSGKSGHATIESQLIMWMGQVQIMKTFATAHGKTVTPQAAILVAEAEDRVDRVLRKSGDGGAVVESDARTVAVQKLLAAHAALCEIVKPATPESIRFSMPELVGLKGTGSPRNRFLLANVGLAALSVALFLWGASDGTVIVGGAAKALESGAASGAASTSSAGAPPKVLDGVALLFGAGGLGASFFNLYWIHHYLVERTFDRQYCTAYYVRWAMGLMAGFILAKVVFVGVGRPATNLTPALLAALGGFAADSVNDILLRLTETVKTLIAGRGDQAIKAQAEAFEAEAKRVRVQSQVEMARDLSRVMSEARKDGSPETLLKNLQGIIDAALGTPPPKPQG